MANDQNVGELILACALLHPHGPVPRLVDRSYNGVRKNFMTPVKSPSKLDEDVELLLGAPSRCRVTVTKNTMKSAA